MYKCYCLSNMVSLLNCINAYFSLPAKSVCKKIIVISCIRNDILIIFCFVLQKILCTYFYESNAEKKKNIKMQLFFFNYE